MAWSVHVGGYQGGLWALERGTFPWTTLDQGWPGGCWEGGRSPGSEQQLSTLGPFGLVQAFLSFLLQCLPHSAFCPICPPLSPYTASGPWALQGDPPVSTSV